MENDRYREMVDYRKCQSCMESCYKTFTIEQVLSNQLTAKIERDFNKVLFGQPGTDFPPLWISKSGVFINTFEASSLIISQLTETLYIAM